MQQQQQQEPTSPPSPWRRAKQELNAPPRAVHTAPTSVGVPVHAAAAHASSPVNASSRCSVNNSSNSANRLSDHERPRSARSLLSRIFRSSSASSKSKSKTSPLRSTDSSDADYRQHHAAATPSPILATSMDALQLHHRESLVATDNTSHLDSQYYYVHDQSKGDDLRRRESAPAQMKSYGLHDHHPQQQQQQQQLNSASMTVNDHAAARRVLVQGYLTKLPARKYWHAKPSYFVLEESSDSGVVPATLCVTLRQFRKHEDALAEHSDLVLSELVLSEDDVVVDISQQLAKHGFELMLAAARDASLDGAGDWVSSTHAVQQQQDRNSHTGHASTGSTALAARSIRFAAPDALALEQWISAVGTAIARLIFQATAQSAHHRSGHSTAHPLSHTFAGSAKVAPIVSDAGNNNSDDGDGSEEIRQAEQQQFVDAADGDDDDEEKPRRPAGALRASSPSTAMQPELDDDKPLRRCPRCDQWMPFDCDTDEQTSCCSRDSNVSDNNNDNSSNNNHRDDASDNQDDADWTDAGADAIRYAQPRASDSFASLRSPPLSGSSSSSSATSFTPSDSPTSSVLLGPNAHPLYVHEPRDIQTHVFSNFIVSPNPPAQISPASPSSSSAQHVYAGKRDACDTADALNELKTPATALARASSTATAFLRSQFARAATAPVPLYRAPPVHSFTASGQVFTLDTRYELIKPIGTGAYGAVIAVQDAVTHTDVAVKKITNIFEDLVDAKRILREVRLLHHFAHKNVTRLLDLAPPASRRAFADMYIITELMETDLHQVIYSMQPMSDDHVKYFLYQMLCALHHIHSAGVLHRDMKPSNVLLNSNCDLKICDFGLARGGVAATAARAVGSGLAATTDYGTRMRDELTEYVVTRWYRAPEIMLNCLQYTEAIDVWAVGCIFAEMLLREPLFPGNDYIHQLKLIITFLGTPKQEDIEFVKNAKALRFLTKLPISKPRKWKDVFATGSGDDGSDVNPLAIDLLSQMLLFNPAKRISVERALRHPYLATFYDPADITPAREFDFAFDLPDDKLTKDALVDLLCEDIEQFHPMSTMVPPPVAPTNSSNGGNTPAAHASRYFVMGTTASAS